MASATPVRRARARAAPPWTGSSPRLRSSFASSSERGDGRVSRWPASMRDDSSGSAAATIGRSSSGWSCIPQRTGAVEAPCAVGVRGPEITASALRSPRPVETGPIAAFETSAAGVARGRACSRSPRQRGTHTRITRPAACSTTRSGCRPSSEQILSAAHEPISRRRAQARLVVSAANTAIASCELGRSTGSAARVLGRVEAGSRHAPRAPALASISCAMRQPPLRRRSRGRTRPTRGVGESARISTRMTSGWGRLDPLQQRRGRGGRLVSARRPRAPISAASSAISSPRCRSDRAPFDTGRPARVCEDLLELLCGRARVHPVAHWRTARGPHRTRFGRPP
jgi:hypothetical protein